MRMRPGPAAPAPALPTGAGWEVKQVEDGAGWREPSGRTLAGTVRSRRGGAPSAPSGCSGQERGVAVGSAPSPELDVPASELSVRIASVLPCLCREKPKTLYLDFSIFDSTISPVFDLP